MLSGNAITKPLISHEVAVDARILRCLQRSKLNEDRIIQEQKKAAYSWIP